MFANCCLYSRLFVKTCKSSAGLFSVKTSVLIQLLIVGVKFCQQLPTDSMDSRKLQDVISNADAGRVAKIHLIVCLLAERVCDFAYGQFRFKCEIYESIPKTHKTFETNWPIKAEVRDE